MKPILLSILFLFIANLLFSQQSDFIVLKKRNGRTLKTYYPGAFISALTVTGFPINGYIKAIRNDSLIIQQEELQLMEAKEGMGYELDTLRYTFGIDYRHIKQFNYQRNYSWGGRNGFVQVTVPKIMMIGGIGFIALELINTIYRHESLNDGNKLQALGIAAGVAAAGFLINQAKTSAKKAGKKYKVIYIKAKSI